VTGTERQPQGGDIYLADLDPTRGSEQAGIRPIIIISADLLNARSKRVIVCPITSNTQPWATKLALPEGLKTTGMVLTDQVRTLDKAQRLLRHVEPVPPEYLVLVRSYVGRWLGLDG
jgi:mRNA interferase MazF